MPIVMDLDSPLGFLNGAPTPHHQNAVVSAGMVE